MTALLYSRTGDLAGARFPISGNVTIGRSDRNDVTLPAAEVAETCARIFVEESSGAWYIESLAGATVRVDDVVVRRPIPLDRLNVISFAPRCDLIFQAEGSPPTPPLADDERAYDPETPAPQTRVVEDVVVPDALPAALDPGAQTRRQGDVVIPPRLPGDDDPGVRTRRQGDVVIPPRLPDDDDPGVRTRRQGDVVIPPRLPGESDRGIERPVTVSISTPRDRSNHRLPEGETVVGRSPECDIVIDDPSLSRRHAAFVIAGGSIVVRDLGSKNGTFVDAERLEGARTIPPGTVVRLGLAVEATIETT